MDTSHWIDTFDTIFIALVVTATVLFGALVISATEPVRTHYPDVPYTVPTPQDEGR